MTLAVGGQPSFLVRILTTEDTPSNKETIPYLPGLVFCWQPCWIVPLMPAHASPGAMGPTTCLARPAVSTKLAAGPTSRAEEPRPSISPAGPTSRSTKATAFSVLAAGPTSRAANVESFFSLSPHWENGDCLGGLLRIDKGDLDRSLGTVATRLPSTGEPFAACPSPPPEVSREGGGNWEIGSESGRSFRSSLGSASRWFSDSESSKISRI